MERVSLSEYCKQHAPNGFPSPAMIKSDILEGRLPGGFEQLKVRRRWYVVISQPSDNRVHDILAELS